VISGVIELFNALQHRTMGSRAEPCAGSAGLF
jgi:hypothetical protein